MYAQALIAISFAVASYQDIKDRAVSDLVWVPALAGAVYIVYAMYPDLGFQLVKIGLVGVIALSFTFFGAVGQADAIALVFLAADPDRISPILPLFAAAAVALVHIGYEYAVGNARGGLTVPIERFLREQRWIPKAIVAEGVRTEVSRDVNVARDEVEASQKPGSMVEVGYGVPTVAYLGVGYLAYLVYLLAFNQAVFYSLP